LTAHRVAKARSWQVLEYHKLVCVWYDAGARSHLSSLCARVVCAHVSHLWRVTEGRDPPYLPPRIKQIDEGKFVYRGKYDALVKMHIQVSRHTMPSLAYALVMACTVSDSRAHTRLTMY
jgi:hypothetical protein